MAPAWRNIWVEPEARLISDVSVAGMHRRAEIEVTGLVCHTLCVNNAYRYLRKVDGVERIGFDRESDTFIVEYVGTASKLEELKQAIRASVVAKGLRRALSRKGNSS